MLSRHCGHPCNKYHVKPTAGCEPAVGPTKAAGCRATPGNRLRLDQSATEFRNSYMRTTGTLATTTSFHLGVGVGCGCCTVKQSVFASRWSFACSCRIHSQLLSQQQKRLNYLVNAPITTLPILAGVCAQHFPPNNRNARAK